MSDVYEVIFFSSFFFDQLVVAFTFIVDETTALRKHVDSGGRTRSASFFTAISEFVVYKLSAGVKKAHFDPEIYANSLVRGKSAKVHDI